jgi:hypothetical protein
MSASDFTEADLTAIRSAIASGELSIMKDGRRVEFRSIAELERAEQRIMSALTQQGGGVRGGPRRFTFTTFRGE